MGAVETERAQHRATLLPDPEPRPIAVPVISVDDHLIEPPDLFEGRLPATLPAGAPRVVEDEGGTQAGSSRGTATPTSGSTRWSAGPARNGAWSRPASTRCARAASTSTPALQDMDRAGIWASLCFPSLVSGFCGAVYSRAHDRELGLACLRAFNDWHLEVWAGTHAGPHHPPAAALAGRRRGGRGRGARQRRPGLQGGELPRVPGPARLPSIFSGAVGPLLRRLRGDRHRRLPAHRRLVLGPAPLARPALRAAAHRVPRQRAAGRGRVAVVRRAAALPRAAGGDVRGRHRLGADADGPGRLRAGALGVGHREPRLALRPPPERGAAPELLVLLHRRPVRRRAAPRHRRRPHHGGERLPARRLVVARHPARAGRDLGLAARRRAAGGGRGQRGAAVPPPAAGRRRLAPAGA